MLCVPVSHFHNVSYCITESLPEGQVQVVYVGRVGFPKLKGQAYGNSRAWTLTDRQWQLDCFWFFSFSWSC